MSASGFSETEAIRAFAPGRVNLIGDHTDYSGGKCLPMALPLGTTLTGIRGGDRIRVSSDLDTTTADLPLDDIVPSESEGWARYVAAVAAEVRPAVGFTGHITTTLPIGAGLSSSAALEVAACLALGFRGSHLELAQCAQRAEHAAVGVPCGIMDQLTSVAGQAGHALLIDCHSLEVTPVPVPDGVEIRIIDPGQPRKLVGSAYAERRAACERAAELIGPLRLAAPDAVAEINDPVLARRARHVITESQRVTIAARALPSGDWATVGDAMYASHCSLRDDFEVSTPLLDSVVDTLMGTPGVHGARLTGAGFGGCVVVLCEPGAIAQGIAVAPSDGARVTFGATKADDCG